MADKQPTPLAFMSYVRFDDEHENGRLTQFRTRLSGEVRMQTGDDFAIFQDRNDIQWGQNWKQRIEESLDSVTFLIPIITPNFFNSPACREELEKFLERERVLKRNDLILPVYYVGSKVLDEESKRAQDKLAQEIAKHQYADWRELRFEPFTSPQVGKTLAQLAIQIRDALERANTSAKTAAKRAETRKRASSRTQSKAGLARSPVGEQVGQRPQPSGSLKGSETARPSGKTEPTTLVVDRMHRGDFATITEAIAAAEAGYRILVRPGLYQEGLLIDKPLEIIGAGNAADVVIQATGQNAVLFKATMGRISNLSLRQSGRGTWQCVDITQGRLELEGCDLTSESGSCLAIHDGADPRIMRNRIHDGQSSGVYVYASGLGTLEDNDIFGNALSNVSIKSNGNPTLRRNRIHDSKQNGVMVYENGQGTLENNDIFGNGYSGIEIREHGNSTVRNNRIKKNAFYGITIRTTGGGTFEDNDVRDNRISAFWTSEDSMEQVKRARNQE
ncbi:MAG TPA: right-handed parallel beta-helix repeat-containing protein [Pyrinomonadaceae bacterium]|nr:right-handed parallel beta-helix repeat-containing protein [Pyrinomonadaceae bacterium]